MTCKLESRLPEEISITSDTGSQRVEHDLATEKSMDILEHIYSYIWIYRVIISCEIGYHDLISNYILYIQLYTDTQLSTVFQQWEEF